jgi:large subunit ribosomal protein L25
VDFYQVRLDEKVKVTVPLVFAGESPAVKNEGGVLVKSLQELEIEALPTNIPEEITVDISSLETFGDSIYVRDLAIPANVEVVTAGDSAVASVQPPRTEEELKALEEAPVAGAAEVITEAEAKKKEEEAAQAEASQASQSPPSS